MRGVEPAGCGSTGVRRPSGVMVMILLTSGLLLVLEVGLAVFCFVDMVLTPEPAVPYVPRWGWVLALLVFPLVGAVGWLVAGHPHRHRLRSGTPNADDTATGTAPQAPDAGHTSWPAPARTSLGSLADDAAYLAHLWEVNEEQERILQRWEEDLRRREHALRDREGKLGAA